MSDRESNRFQRKLIDARARCQSDLLSATESDLNEVALTKIPLKLQLFVVVVGIVLWALIVW